MDRRTSAEAAIDAAFEGMAEDAEYQAEVARIMKEFAQADWEAWCLAEQAEQVHARDRHL